jgi:hypothetical protein
MTPWDVQVGMRSTIPWPLAAQANPNGFRSENEPLHMLYMHMPALINPTVLPALRIAATFFFIVNLVGGAYIFRNRHRFFGQDPNVTDDIPAVRKLRVEVVLIPWSVLTTLLVIYSSTYGVSNT